MNGVIAFALRHRGLMLLMLAAMVAAGVFAFRQLNIEAYPDPVPPLVDIVTQSTGQSAEEIERYVTIPIEVQLAGIPHVKTIRTISLFGLSDVKVQFTYDFTYDQAEQRVINRLSQLGPLPNGASAQISPVSPIGEIYRYRLVGPTNYSVTDLKTLQDWVLQRRFKAVPGVIDVTGWGGKTKTYDVTIDKAKLIAHGLTLPQIIQVIGNSNVNVGGQTVNFGPQAAIVRGIGLIQTVDQLRNTMITSPGGSPVLLSDIATISVGHLPRLGVAGQGDDNDIVEGIVLMQRGEKSMPTIRAVEDEVKRVNTSGILPPGVQIEKIYDRSDLIAVTTHTVLDNMLFGIVLIFLVQWVFLGNFRTALIVSATVPFALFFAVLIMILRGESANLLSVGAIDFGLVVDATVIMVENIYRHLAEPRTPPPVDSARAAASRELTTIADAAAEVNKPIFFSAAIITASFVPLFTLTGVEGHIFGPMAQTYAYAIAGGLIATFTVSPALSAILLPEKVDETDTMVVRGLRRLYQPVLRFALANRIVTLGGAGILLVIALLAGRTLGLEFLPHLEEGNFWIRATMPAAISLEAGDDAVNRMRQVIGQFPEVQTVVSQHGRPDDGTDSTGFFNTEFFVPLKPFNTWPHGMDKAKLTKALDEALSAQFPGVDFNFSQNIQDNVEEAASGVKGENSLKLFGPDLAVLQSTAGQIRDTMATVPGVTDLAVLTSLGQPTVQIEIDRAKAARFGLAPGDINATVQAAIGGQSAGNFYEPGSDRNFPIVVRLQPEDRGDLAAIRSLPIGAASPNGGVVQATLADVADVRLTSGAAFIYRENQERYIPIKFSVRGRDLGGAVLEAQRAVAEKVKVPGGYHLEWVGELGELQSALTRLEVVVPLSLLLIGLLLFLNFSRLSDTLLAASVMPMAMIGGVLALFVTHTPLSISAAIGFIGLFGISVMNGIIVLSSFNRLVGAGSPRDAALLRACETQLRPVAMTSIAACVGLLPAALSTAIGSQVQRPLALVVVGGMLLAPALVLVVLPVLIDVFSRRGLGPRRANAGDPPDQVVET
ncbi:CusA/CzcA family heavy metal efflux RND transporter [Phenylobacterium sp.]|uniref:efflux RND transporter permease subunit n=1 Tax=Phenylobacterium sp. TaxID=1871053 RepID=UPI0012096E89|nr:CusA/CzcA family heavy metal efflux RND transporter [Phenylobacterium sp.]THD65285.1 MAG: efflux RND transporter permease subunit [Phenylobacterium sp.]